MTTTSNTITAEQLDALSDDEAVRIFDHIQRRALGIKMSRRKAWEAQQIEAGQVWKAVYWSHWHKYTEVCFSLSDAVGYLSGGLDAGNLAPDSVVLPDGTILSYEEATDAVENQQEAHSEDPPR